MSGRRQERAAKRRLPLARRVTITAASALATLAVAIVILAVAGVMAYTSPGPPARQGAETTVILRRGSGVQEIAAELEDRGVIRSGSLFVAAAQLTGAGRSLKAGEYAFPSRASLGQVVSTIRQGKIVHHLITIPEGLTSEQAVAILTASGVLSGSAPVPAEGSLLPETYEVVRGTDRATVLKRMTDAHDRLVAELWPKRRADLPYKSADEALILASIVEKETGNADERPRVAAVFVNRLQKGLRLESDPTIIYGLTRGRPLGHGIRQSELTTPTPYNTYLIGGLPPTPICNPGRASIAAVLDPPKTNELYFVANGTGGHTFASTFDAHLKNVEHLRQIERERPSHAAPQGAAALRGEQHNGGR